MKNTLLFLSLLSLAIAGQAQEIDTSWTEIRWGYNPETGDSTFYERTTIQYKDGRFHIPVETIAGDTATVINFFYNRATEAARLFAQYVNRVWQKPQVVNFILQANGVLQSEFDTTLIEIGVARQGPEVDSTTWDIISEQGNFTGLLTIHPSGQSMRMRIGATNYTLLPVGDAWIRFQGIPQGGSTDLLLKTGGRGREFRSIDQRLIIRKRT